MTGRERMEAVFRGEMVDRLPRKGEDYSDVLFLLEDPQQVKDGGGYDAFGVYFRKSNDGMTPDPVNTPLHDICDWRTIQFPDPAKLGMEEDAKKVKAGYDPATQMLRLHVPFCHFCVRVRYEPVCCREKYREGFPFPAQNLLYNLYSLYRYRFRLWKLKTAAEHLHPAAVFYSSNFQNPASPQTLVLHTALCLLARISLPGLFLFPVE